MYQLPMVLGKANAQPLRETNDNVLAEKYRIDLNLNIKNFKLMDNERANHEWQEQG